jgi:hypothetical protein
MNSGWVGSTLANAGYNPAKFFITNISNQSADLELAPYFTHVREHLFSMKSQNVTDMFRTFGSVKAPTV